MRTFLLLAILGTSSARISGFATLRLRGGAWGAGQQQVDDASVAVAAQEAMHAESNPAAAPAHPTLVTHAVEYALAGSFDGIRSGIGQAVGGQVAAWVGGALQKTGSGAGLAFANIFGRLPFLKGKVSGKPIIFCVRVCFSTSELVPKALWESVRRTLRNFFPSNHMLCTDAGDVCSERWGPACRRICSTFNWSRHLFRDCAKR
jgi:hypothetical protein